MKTIEDRAYEWSLEEARTEGYDFASLKEGYIKGAREQKMIDIDKACDAFCKSQCGKVTSGCGECGKYKVFRKEMEDVL